VIQNVKGSNPVTDPSPGEALVLTEEQALEIITFLTSAAELCLHEPVYYVTVRLVDGASRMMGLILENNPQVSVKFFTEFKAYVDANKALMMWDRDQYFAFLRSIPAQAATEFKRVRELADSEWSAS
jgi:hypothetical protein